eukprot:3961024-Pleurochrysis_carterae.AAC.1
MAAAALRARRELSCTRVIPPKLGADHCRGDEDALRPADDDDTAAAAAAAAAAALADVTFRAVFVYVDALAMSNRIDFSGVVRTIVAIELLYGIAAAVLALLGECVPARAMIEIVNAGAAGLGARVAVFRGCKRGVESVRDCCGMITRVGFDGGMCIDRRNPGGRGGGVRSMCGRVMRCVFVHVHICLVQELCVYHRTVGSNAITDG